MALSKRDQQFVLEYLKDYNATQAMIRCGHQGTHRSAQQAGWERLNKPEVRAEIDRLDAEKQGDLKTSAKDIERMLSELASVDLHDIFTADGDVKPLTEMPPRARRAIAGIEVEIAHDREGNEIGRTKKIKLWDKKGALELLGRYRRMFTDRVEVEGQAAKVEIQIKAE
jgi:phage terminase small subunit